MHDEWLPVSEIVIAHPLFYFRSQCRAGAKEIGSADSLCMKFVRVCTMIGDGGHSIQPLTGLAEHCLLVSVTEATLNMRVDRQELFSRALGDSPGPCGEIQ